MADVRLAQLNKVLLSGRLTRDPELRYTPNGASVSSFSLAVNRGYKGQDGQWKQQVAFVNVAAWGKLAVLTNEYLKKGSAAFVEGRLSSRSWQTEDGQKRSAIEVVADRIQFLDRIAKPEGMEEEFVEAGESGPAPDADEEVPF
ncbi:MAG: single-stranded DNA-binding protein [Candidatus Eisenbacteria bacterium]|jgi:single-strand DNA-binding protein